MIVRLLIADESFAQQQLHVTVIAAAGEELAAAHVIEAAVAHVRPPARTLLDQAHSAGGTRALLQRQLHPELHHLLVRAPERHVQEPQGIEQGLRGMPEGLDDRLLRDLRGARAGGGGGATPRAPPPPRQASASPPLPSATTSSAACSATATLTRSWFSSRPPRRLMSAYSTCKRRPMYLLDFWRALYHLRARV